MSRAGVKNHFARWREWEINPIVIKELRQAVRSRILSGSLMLLLLALFLGSVAALAGQNVAHGEVFEMGRKMFDVCLAVLTVSGLVCIPIYTGTRVALEKHQADLILYTPLPATKLVNGKFLGGVYIAGLFFSICVPFMTFSSLLRGLDWFTIQFVLIALFIATCVAILGAMAVGVLPLPIPMKLACGTAFVGGLVLLSLFLLHFFFEVVRSGITPLLKSPGSGNSFVSIFGLTMFSAAMSYNLSISYIIKHGRSEIPPASNAQEIIP